MVYVAYVPRAYEFDVEPIIDFVNFHIDPRFHRDIAVYFYDEATFEDVIRLTSVRVCGEYGSEMCYEWYRKQVVDRMRFSLGLYYEWGRFMIVSLEALRSFPRFAWLLTVFHETLHGVYERSGHSSVHRVLFSVRYPRYVELDDALREKGLFDDAYFLRFVIDFVLNEFYALSGEATFLVALRRDCFDDLRPIANYVSRDLGMRSSVRVFNETIRPYWGVVGVEGRDLDVSDLVPLYPSVCRSLKSVFVRFPADTYRFWDFNFGLFDGIESYWRKLED